MTRFTSNLIRFHPRESISYCTCYQLVLPISLIIKSPPRSILMYSLVNALPECSVLLTKTISQCLLFVFLFCFGVYIIFMIISHSHSLLFNILKSISCWFCFYHVLYDRFSKSRIQIFIFAIISTFLGVAHSTFYWNLLLKVTCDLLIIQSYAILSRLQSAQERIWLTASLFWKFFFPVCSVPWPLPHVKGGSRYITVSLSLGTRITC